MNLERRQQLIEQCRAQIEPFATLEEFFEGNDDQSSIGCNLANHPGLDVSDATLAAIRARPPVHEVTVAISEWEEDDQNWPFSDAVTIFAEATEDEVRAGVAPLQADDPVEIKAAISRAPARRPDATE